MTIAFIDMDYTDAILAHKIEFSSIYIIRAYYIGTL